MRKTVITCDECQDECRPFVTVVYRYGESSFVPLDTEVHYCSRKCEIKALERWVKKATETS